MDERSLIRLKRIFADPTCFNIRMLNSVRSRPCFPGLDFPSEVSLRIAGTKSEFYPVKRMISGMGIATPNDPLSAD